MYTKLKYMHDLKWSIRLIFPHCNRFVIFVAGAAVITTPAPNPQEAIAHGNKNGLLFAADTAALSKTGHVTIFTEETILAQIPTKDGIVPPHKVLYEGGCKGAELVM